MSFAQIFSRIQHRLKYGDFYKCTFYTWDTEKKQIAPKTSKKDRKLVFISVGINGLYLLLQIIATIKTPQTILVDVVETVGITMIAFITLALRFDIDNDYSLAQLLNYISGMKQPKGSYVYFDGISCLQII
jgi:hypothetical protein